MPLAQAAQIKSSHFNSTPKEFGAIRMPMVTLGRSVRWRIALAILGGVAFLCHHLTRDAVAQLPSGVASPDPSLGTEVTLDAELVGRILAGERRLAAAIRSCSGEITKSRLPLTGLAANVTNRANNEQRLKFGIHNGSTRAEFLTNAPNQVSQVLLATPSGSYRLLPVGSGNGANGIFTAFDDPATEEVATTIEADVIGMVGALLCAPGAKGSDYLATTTDPVTKYSSELVPNGIRMKSSFDHRTDKTALPSENDVLAADFEMVLDAECDYAVRYFRSKTVLPKVTHEMERTINVVSSRDGSFVPHMISTRILTNPAEPATEQYSFDETTTINFDTSLPRADTFTRAWIEKLAGNVRVDSVDRNGTPVPHPLPVLPAAGLDPIQKALLEPRAAINPWLLANAVILAVLAGAWLLRRRTLRQ